MDYPIFEAEKEIKQSLRNVLDQIKYYGDIKLVIPKKELGDFAFPCFILAKIVKKPIQEISQNIVKNVKKIKWIERVEDRNGYVNFFLDYKNLAMKTLEKILEMKGKYGNLKEKNKRVIIEHTSANPNGPLHIGRARNPIIGDTLVRIYRAAGYNVESQFYLDDLGKQVAILTWGINNIDPKNIPKSEIDKPDHINVGFYQETFQLIKKNKEIAKEVSEIMKKSEKGDKKTIDLIHNAYSKVLEGIEESLEKINIYVDKYVPESTFVKDKSVDKVINKLKKTPYCYEQNGAFYLDLKSFGIQGRNTNFFFLRSDGTSLYATRDVAYHIWKAKQANILINVLGEDHKLEAKQVETALKLLEVKNLPKPVFYSFVSMPGGKMSTRRGHVVYLDQLINECIKRAYKEVKKRRANELSNKKMKEISKIVGIGALRYNIIKVQPEKDIVFKWDDALNFEGNSSPFIQYAHARACSILLKKEDELKSIDSYLLNHNTEVDLIKKLAWFPYKIKDACISCRPHIITNYLNDLASKFNQFYRDCPVLSEKNEKIRRARIALVDSTRMVLENGLNLIGVIAPEEM